MAKVALYCQDVVGKAMAGPAIRYWEFAKALSKFHDVTLFVPDKTDLQPEGFNIVPYKGDFAASKMNGIDVIITQSVNCFAALPLKKKGIRIILDAYDPVPLEALELFKHFGSKERDAKCRKALEEQLFSIKMADAMICASEKQKDLWMGVLMALGRLTPEVYDQDSSLQHLIDVVPFGLSTEPPVKSGPGLRERFGLKPSDKVILWGGGIWNWFDPLSLIKAVKKLSGQRNDIKLVFMGVKHPSDKIPEMEMCKQAVQLAKDLDLFDRHVFFNFGWVPYAERQNYLLDADVGASIHLEHLETRFSFRTRMLDYIWAGLPIIGTQGDSFAELIENNNLGVVVPYNNVEAIASAITAIIDRPEVSQMMRNNLLNLRTQFYWENLISPILKIIERLTREPRPKIGFNDISLTAQLGLNKIRHTSREKGLSQMFKTICNKLQNLIN